MRIQAEHPIIPKFLYHDGHMQKSLLWVRLPNILETFLLLEKLAW